MFIERYCKVLDVTFTHAIVIVVFRKTSDSDEEEKKPKPGIRSIIKLVSGYRFGVLS